MVKHPRPSRIQTRRGRLSSVFPASHAKVMHQHMARLCVLFEDLRIEVLGMALEDLEALDHAGSRIRRLYFQRRSVGTLVEFAEALRLLDGCSDFSDIKRSFDPQSLRVWSRAVDFFRKQERFMKKVRHDVGGHFGSPAARFAVENFGPFDAGSMQVSASGSGGGGVKFTFAGEIAATALFRHLRGCTPQRKVDHFLRICSVACRHAIRAVECIAGFYLWKRFTLLKR